MARGDALKVPHKISDDLAAVIGTKKAKVSRGEITSRIWKYIKKHGLQAEDDKRTIEPDELLGDVIGHKPINMFKMTKKIQAHILD